VKFSAPRLLQSDDNAADFSCGVESLDDWLKNIAGISQREGYARIFVSLYPERERAHIAGYCALTCAHIPIHNNKSGDIFNPGYILPCVYLACLAVDKKAQRQNVGNSLLWFAMERALRAAEYIGISLFITEPLAGAEEFYKIYNFRAMELSSGKTIFYRTIQDIRESLGSV